MIFNNLQAKNFMSFEALDFALDNRGLVLIEGDNQDLGGSNGSGKSAIAESLIWTLFGQTVRGVSGDEIIRKGADSCSAELSIELSLGKCRISRSRKRGKGGELSFSLNGHEENLSSMKDTQRKIEELLNTDYVSFVNSIVFGQGVAKFFASSTDAERKEILGTILEFARFDKALEKAKIVKSAAEQELSEQERSIAILETRMEDSKSRIGDYKKQIENFEEQQKRKLSVAEQSIKDKSQEIDTLEKESIDILHLEARLKETGKIHSVRNSEMDEFRAKERVCIAGIGAIEGRRKKEESDLRKFMELKAGEKCPYCKSVLADKHILQMREEITSSVGKCKEEEKTEYKKLEKLQSEKSSLKSSILKLDEEIDEITDNLQEEKTLKFSIKEKRRFLQSLQDNYDVIKKEKCEVAPLRDEEFINLENFSKSRSKKIEILTNEKRKSEDADFWIKGFGNQGVKSFLFDCIIPVFEKRANYYLQILCDGKAELHFDTVSKLKSGETREKFDVRIISQTGADVYKSSSGGEKRRIDLAILLALRNLVIMRKNNSANLFVADEIFDNLDAIGIRRAMEILREEAKDSSVFVISHEDKLEDYFDNRVRVVKKGGVSALAN